MHGQAKLIRFRMFERVEWEAILCKNRIDENDVIELIVDPEFFKEFDFPHFSESQIAKSKNDFFGSNSYYGPLSSQMAIVEVKLARKKLFRGSLNRFLGIDTMFPLVNIVSNSSLVNHSEGFVTVVCVEEFAGQVVNSFSVIEEFDPELFKIELMEIKFGNHLFSLISEFRYKELLFKNLRSDYVVRSQWSLVI